MDSNNLNNQNDNTNNQTPNGTVNINGQEFKVYYPDKDGNPQPQPSQNNVQPHDKKYISPEDNKKANMLSIISLVCMFGVPTVMMLLKELISYIDSSMYAPFIDATTSISGAAFIAAMTIMILVRVKYPNSLFGKVLMWLYIVIVVLGILGIIALLVFIYMMCNMCTSMG